MDGLSKNALCPRMHRSKNALHSMGEIADQDAFCYKFCVAKMKQNLTVDSLSGVLRQLRKQLERPHRKE